MPNQPNSSSPRAFVSLSELAEDILQLSRARLYELIERGAMPMPVYDLRSRRPVFTSEQQQQALLVRKTGVGIDGSAVIFYRRNQQVSQPPATPSRPRQRALAPQARQYAQLVSSLQALGVSQANEQTVSAAVSECFPNGLDGQDEADVLRVLFRHLRRRESA